MNSSSKYIVILSDPQGGTEQFHFNSRQKAEELAQRIRFQKSKCSVSIKYPFRNIFASEIKRFKKSFYSNL